MGDRLGTPGVAGIFFFMFFPLKIAFFQVSFPVTRGSSEKLLLSLEKSWFAALEIGICE
jgi:hypothetical protein